MAPRSKYQSRPSNAGGFRSPWTTGCWRHCWCWYRLHQNPETEKFHHGLQYENSVGIWFFKTFLAAEVGPMAQPDTFSTWPE